MGKYGWTKGTGLGANESGIVNPLRVQVEKRRKKADADGGGWAEPGGKGKILGGKRKDETSRFGTMSDVIVLQNMLEGMPDLQAEIADGLGQEIGEECGEKVNLSSLLHTSPPLLPTLSSSSLTPSAQSAVVFLTNLVQYGRVERLYIDQENLQVFIKFTDQVSALRVCLARLLRTLQIQ